MFVVFPNMHKYRDVYPATTLLGVVDRSEIKVMIFKVEVLAVALNVEKINR